MVQSIVRPKLGLAAQFHFILSWDSWYRVSNATNPEHTILPNMYG